ncbi:phosphotransferase [Oleiagrimonas citrea]|uniref:Phosphotransferase n=1 Tax=Oleiagrimonas citrea TaxID=1665687 RepID=A0A846ZJ33_9GAMM|nr:phosphotransferase [Oleiagrimonas citrea]NKZ38016.1 phosphotransferase [Oleiagrimonas citrea]
MPALPDTERCRQCARWTRRALDDDDATLEVASADASFRSYYRVHSGGRSLIVMDAPPGQEDIAPWLDIGRRLRAAGLHTPEVLADDAGQGFVLMSDLGNTHYLDVLADDNVDALYGEAMETLLRMQTGVDPQGLPPYDEPFLVREMELMPTWFLERHLSLTPDCGQWDVLELAFRHLVVSALAQPRVFVHRDFHSRNLLVTPDRSPGIIDFQGALVGPLTYDLASLLRDCYIVWDREHVEAWTEQCRLQWRQAGHLDADVDAARFRRWFDLIGLQRHIKVLGIFCRLHYRDGKDGYLHDLPRVLDYVLDVAGRYPELHDFCELLRRAVGDRDVAQARVRAAT